MGKYAEDAKQLLHLVGGKENIAAVSHCMTRMRFALADPEKADVKAIEAMKVVKGSFTQSGQFQVIIGNTVADFYNDFVKEAGIEGVSKDAVKQAAKKNQNGLQRAITALAEIFAPLIPAIITGGLILGFRNCIDSLYLFENGTKTLCDISQFWAGIDSFLWLIGEAVFHMLPVGICWSVTKKMGTTKMLGIVLVRHQPVLGGNRQLPVAHRRGRLPYAAGGHLLVGYKEDGHHADAGHRPGPDAGVRTIAECLCGWRNCGGRYPQVELWRLPGQYDRLSGPGYSRHFSSIYTGVSGKILPEDYAPGDFHDCCSFLQFAVVGNGGTFCIRPHWLEDWGGNLRNRICRNYRNI